jgi:hypothetical protein
LRTFRLAVILALVVSTLGVPSAAELLRLDTAADPPIDSVLGFKLALDQRSVVAIGRSGARLYVYSFPLDGGEPVVLGPDGGAAEIFSLDVSPDGTKVLFKVKPAPTAALDLWCAPAAGPAWSARVLAHDLWSRVEFTPDSSRAIFETRVDGISPLGLRSAPVCGEPGDATLLNEPSDDASPTWFRAAPDSQHVLYAEYPSGLMKVAALDGGPVHVVSPYEAGTEDDLAFVHGGETVIYTAWTGDWLDDLLVDPLPNGGASTKCLTCESGTGVFDLYDLGADVVAVDLGSETDPGLHLVDHSQKTPELVPLDEDWMSSGGIRLAADGAQLAFLTQPGGSVALRVAPVPGSSGSDTSLPVLAGEEFGEFHFVDSAGGTLVLRSGVGSAGRCYRWETTAVAAEPLHGASIPFSGEGVDCRPVPGRSAVLSLLSRGDDAPCCGAILTHLRGPVDASHYDLLAGPNAPDYLWYDIQVTADGEWMVFRTNSLETWTRVELWARRLPLFWDGFESGTVGHWGGPAE